MGRGRNAEEEGCCRDLFEDDLDLARIRRGPDRDDLGINFEVCDIVGMDVSVKSCGTVGEDKDKFFVDSLLSSLLVL